MAQATYSIRLDQDKKTKFDAICERLGLTASAAFSTFVNKTIETQGLPYSLTLEKTPSSFGVLEIDDLTQEELMAEIQKGLDSAENEETYTMDEVLRNTLGDKSTAAAIPSTSSSAVDTAPSISSNATAKKLSSSESSASAKQIIKNHNHLCYNIKGGCTLLTDVSLTATVL